MTTAPLATWSHAEKLGDAMRRSLPRLGPEVREEIEKLLNPETLAIIAAVLGLWVGSHFIGIGEIIDVILVAVGVFAIGLAVFDGIGELSHQTAEDAPYRGRGRADCIGLRDDSRTGPVPRPPGDAGRS
jgi:hypothetical protein